MLRPGSVLGISAVYIPPVVRQVSESAVECGAGQVCPSSLTGRACSVRGCLTVAAEAFGVELDVVATTSTNHGMP